MNRAQRRAAAKNGKTSAPLTATWFSNAPWAGTGYGTQTAQVVERMKRDGHFVAVSCNYGLQAMQTTWNDIPIYPMGVEAYSNDVAAANYADWSRRNPDGIPHMFVLFDAWVLKGKHWDETPTSIWTMVDHMPVPPAVATVLRKPNITPIAVTRFGQTEIERQDIAAEYIPMAIDTNLYRPTEKWDGISGRELMGLKADRSEFVVSIINANKGVPGRKAWGENLTAAAIFASRHDDVRIYIHTERHGNHGGMQLDPLIKAVGLKEHQFRFVNQYANHVGIPNEAMAALYTATDVLLAATLGEGFGLTALEAASCGTRVICNDFSAQPELVSADSWLTDGQPWWDAAQFAWWHTPSVPSIVDALEQAYAKGQSRSEQQREHALQYDADLVWDQYWRPYLAKLAAPTPTTSPVLLDGAAPRKWTNGVTTDDVRLTCYVPTYKRPELASLLASLKDQLDRRTEVIISDDDPEGSAWPIVREYAQAHFPITYECHPKNLGGNINSLRGFSQGVGAWFWMFGDDDTVLPGKVKDIFEAIDHDDIDRLILLSPEAPSDAAGMLGTPAQIAEADPGLLVAATLTSANVVRRSALDMSLGVTTLDTMYAPSFVNTTCRRVRVLADPAITVGKEHGGQYAAKQGFTGDPAAIWTDLLHAYGIEDVQPKHFSWNYLSAGMVAR